MRELNLERRQKYLPAGELRPALANVAVALKLDPLIPFRPRGYQKVAKKLSEKFRGSSNL